MTGIDVIVPAEVAGILGSLESAAQPAVEGAAAGVERALRDHFAALQRRPRKDGLAPVGFWSGTDGDSVAERIGDPQFDGQGGAAIGIDDPRLGHKIEGGTIRAADYGKTYLTIPANDEAARAPRGARSFATRIEWRPHPDGGVRPALVAGSNYARATKSRKTGEVRRKYTEDAAKANAGAGDTLFWLVRQVTHKPMPDALPAQDALESAARDGALDALDAILASAAQAAQGAKA